MESIKFDRKRQILIYVILATIPCYCLGMAVLQGSKWFLAKGTTTPTPNLTETGAAETLTALPTSTGTITATYTPSITPTPSWTPSQTFTPFRSPTYTITNTPLPPTDTPSPTPSLTPEPPTDTPSVTPTETPSLTPEISETLVIPAP
jgi:hypothetical protein